MNKFESISKPLKWFMALLLVALMVGCGGGSGNAPLLLSIAVTPATTSAPIGGIQQFVSTARYSDGSSRVVTATSHWTSSNLGVATVNSTSGVATGVATGTSVITATFGGKSATATLTVTSATLTSIAVTPATASIASGLTQAFVATATYSDGSSGDVTTSSSWTSASTSVATIISTTGVATGVASGTSVITAAFGGQTATATLHVTTATLTSIAVTPATPSIASGLTQAFVATATYSDGTHPDVTASSAWTSATTSVATIVSNTGVATGHAAGTSVITATFGGKSATATMLVTNATLTSIAVTPATPSVAIGLTQALVATATYSDGTHPDVTASSAWTSATPGVATVNGTSGVATGVAIGTSVITATFGGQTATVTLTVTAATVTSVAVTPATPSIAVSGTQPFVAIAAMSDGSHVTVTTDPSAVWTSVNIPVGGTAVATLSPSGVAGAGVATGTAVGLSTITATFGGKSGSTVLTVTTAASVLPGAGATPKVLSSSPTTGDINVPTSSNSTIAAANNTVTGKLVKATFSEAMSASSVAAAFTLYDNTAASSVPGTVTMNTANTEATFKPTAAALIPGDNYTATITTAAVTSPAGTPIANTVAWSFTTSASALTGQEPVDLLSVLTNNFVILANVNGITDVPTSAITGNIGVSSTAGSTAIGVPCSEMTGIIYAPAAGGPACATIDPTLLTTAISDMGTASVEAAGRTQLVPVTGLGAGDISGMTLTPGIYTWSTFVLINAGSPTGDATGVTLDCQGNSNAVFIFQIAQYLTVGSGARVNLIGSCQAKNIFWSLGTDATLSSTSVFNGTILTATQVVMQGSAALHGRALAHTWVTLISNTVGP